MDRDEILFRVAHARLEDDNLVLRVESKDASGSYVERLRRSVHQDPKWAVGTALTIVSIVVLGLIIQPLLSTYATRVQQRNDDFAARREMADAVASATAPFLAEMEFFVSQRTSNEGLDRFDLQRIYNATERQWLSSAALVDAKMVGLYEGSRNSALVATWGQLKDALRRLHRLSSYEERTSFRQGWYGVVQVFLDAHARPDSDLVTDAASEASTEGDTSAAGIETAPDRCDQSNITPSSRDAVVEGRSVGSGDSGRVNVAFRDAYFEHVAVFSACRDLLVREILGAETRIRGL